MALVPVFDPATGASGGPADTIVSNTDFQNIPYEIVNLNTQGYSNVSAGGRGFSSITYDGNGVGSYTINAGTYPGGILYTTTAYIRDASGNKVTLTDSDSFKLSFRLSEVVNASNPAYSYNPALRLKTGVSGKNLDALYEKTAGVFKVSGYGGFVQVGNNTARTFTLDMIYTAGNMTTVAGVAYNASGAKLGQSAQSNLWSNTGTPLEFMMALFNVSGSASSGDIIKFKAEIRAYKLT